MMLGLSAGTIVLDPSQVALASGTALPASDSSSSPSLLDYLLGPTGTPTGYVGPVGSVPLMPLTEQNAQICSSNVMYPLLSDCWGYSLSAWQTAAALGTNLAAVTVNPTPPAAPTQAQTDACADPSLTADEASTCASNLAQSLSNAALAQTQANINAAAQTAPPVPTTTPFCGTGSTQWISGIDNCVLLGVSALCILLVFAKMK